MKNALLWAEGGDIAERIFADAARSYIRACRERVDPFIDRTYTLAGAIDVHRTALGWDLLRAPVNISLGVPTAAARLAAFGARRAGRTRTADWLDDRHFFLETDVDREIRWRLHSDFLQLPLRQRDRTYDHDALSAAILSHPELAGAADDVRARLAAKSHDPLFRARFERTMERYIGARAASAEIATIAFSTGAGILAFHQITPSAFSLGPAIAAAVAHHAAVSGFPLGAGVGAVWYGLFPAAPPAALIAGATGAVLAGVIGLSALAGIAADPVQRRLKLHHRRLHRLLDVVEADLVHGRSDRLGIRSHYVARVIDLVDLLRTAYAIAR